MAHIDRHAPGAFCWVELGTTDQDAAKQFYTSVFGWSFQDIPVAPDEIYTMFILDGRNTAAAFKIRPQDAARGIPPYWGLYVCVRNADQCAGRATELGGNVFEGPFDVGEHGRMALVRDPTGAVFSLWQPKKHIGMGVTGVDGTLCWADLNTPRPQAAADFYSALFAWELVPGDEGYLHIKNSGEFIGGISPIRHNSNTPPHWLPYFLTSSADETAMNADARGAKLFMPPTTMENVGRISIMADPQGAVFAIYEAARKAA